MDNNISDDAFIAFAKSQEEEAKNSKEFVHRDYEQIKWAGLETGKTRIIRAVGGPPDSHLDDFTAKSVRISTIVGDNGKPFRCVFPDMSEDSEHIIWRVINLVNKVSWDNGKKFYVNEEKYPDIFNMINKNGLARGHKQFKFEKGWMGRQYLLMNVIDRENMAWHTEHKHTMLLSKNVSEKDGKEYAESGVPSYGFLGPLSNLFKYYKSWQKYDIGIERTGKMEAPYRIVNASSHIEEIPEDIQWCVSKENLTEEEASWERYDLNKLFGYTSASKIYNRLKSKLAIIDAAFGSSFVSELKFKADREQEERKRLEEGLEVSTSNPISQEVKTRRSPQVENAESSEKTINASTGFDTSLLKGWGKLRSYNKEEVEDVIVKDGKVVDVVYKDKNATLWACPACGIPAPDNWVSCPNCGEDFY